MININQIVKSTKVVGPGVRYVMWVQGCKFNCIGCKNLDSHSFEPNILMSVDELFNDILSQSNLTGVTFSGGEPLMQYDEILLLIKRIKSETNLDIMLYTGYYSSEIVKLNMSEILLYVDILVDGRFEIEQYVERKLYGSSNQSIITTKYDINEIENINSCEIHIDRSGEVVILGDLTMASDLLEV